MTDKPTYTTDQILAQLQTQWATDNISYREWDQVTVTYFIGDSTVVGDGKTGESKGWTAMQTDQTNAATEAFSIWNELIANIDLVSTATASDADITFAYSTTTTKDGTYTIPTVGSQSGSVGTDPDYPITHEAVWIDANATTWPTNQTGTFAAFSNYGLDTFEHEIAHALGLSHPDTYDASNATAPTYDVNATFSEDQRKYTIMSYFGYENSDASGWADDGTPTAGLYASTPMVYDIAAIQQKYGADYTTRDGDTTYGYNSNAGWNFFDFNQNNQPVFTIWDGGGNDTIDASGYDKAQTINLTPGAYSSVLGLTDNIAVALEPIGDGRALIENAIGGSGDDTLIGNYGNNHLVGNAGDDRLYGMNGADTLDGGSGDDLLDGGGTGNGIYVSLTDVLTGGAGRDTFVYSPGDHHTTITDFSITDDELDLTQETQVHDLTGLLSYAHQDGYDLVFDFGNSGNSRDVLRLQNMTYGQFATIDPLSLELTASPGITITPNPSDNLSTMFVSVAPLAGGGFVATRFSYVDVVTHQILAFRYDDTGTLVDSVQVNTVPSDAVMVRAIGLSSGKTIVVWDSPNGGAGGTHAILARLLDSTGTPIGDEFTVNQTQFAPGGGSFLLSLTASSGGGADVEYYAPSSLMLNGYPTYFAYRAGISSDGGVVGENNLGYNYQGTYSSNIDYTYAFKNYDYYVQGGTDGKYHAFYKMAGGTPVQLDDGDFFPDSVGLDQPPFQVIQLTDGRILFSYLSGVFQPTYYEQWVNADKVIILNADGSGFTKPGTDGSDYLQGGPGHDQLYGKGGDDVLVGLGGGDLLDGGAGTDTAVYARSTAGVTIDLSIAGPQGGAGDGAGDTLVSIENLTGSDFDDVLKGDSGPNRIDGGKGNDIITGNGGSDMLFGGAGNDRIVLTANVSFDDPVPEAHGGDGDDNITINGDHAVAYGEDGDDTITVNGNHNTVYGGNGSNILTVTAGDGNILFGGSERDFLTGGTGDDALYGGGGDDFFYASPGHDTYNDYYDAGDTLVYRGDFADFSISYDRNSDALTITDLRDGKPEGIATVIGIENFRFHDGDRTLTQLEAAAGPSVDGRAVDGYLAGATVVADADMDHAFSAGEISTITDGQGNFTISGGAAPLLAFGGTDIGTGLAFEGFMSAPSGATVITPLTTLAEILTEIGVNDPVGTVLQAFGLPPGTDLLHIDPIAANAAGDTTAFALLVAGATVISDIALIAAGLESQANATTMSATATAYSAFAAIIASHPTVDLTNPSVLQEIVTQAGLTGDTASQVLATMSSTNNQLQTAPDLAALTVVQTGAQGAAAEALATPAAPAVMLVHDTGASATDHITNDAALTVTPSEAGGTIAYMIDGVAAPGYDPTTLSQGGHTISVTQTNASDHESAATSFSFTYDTVAPNLVFNALAGSVIDDQPLQISGAVGVEDAGRTIQIVEGTTVIGTALAGADGTWHENVTLHGIGDHTLLLSVTDLAGNTDQISTDIAVKAANHAPTAGGDQATTPEHTPLVLTAATLLANDTDPDGDPLSLIGVSNATHGTVNYDPTHNTVTFTPTAGYSGTANFNYTISDGQGGIATGTVGVNVETGSVGGGWGDVHYTTLDGLKYNLQSTGDYVIAETTSGPQFEIQGRAENLGQANVSYLTAVAVEAGDHLIVFDEAKANTMLVDGHAVAFAVGDTLDLGEGVVIGRSTATTHEITTSLDFVQILDHGRYLDLSVHAGAGHAPGSFEGLLGNFDGNAGNEIALHGGTPVLSPSTKLVEGLFADSWRVTADDNMLSSLGHATLAQRVSDAAHNHVDTVSVHDWHFG
jgi:Ca2+-binding RTX toxin-like protein